MTTIANDVQVRLADDVLDSDTSLLIEAAVAPLNNPPEPDTDSVLTLVDRLVGPQQIEIVRYTTVTDNQDGTLTIGGLTRGQEGTAAQAFNAGGYVFQAATVVVLEEFAHTLRVPAGEAVGGGRACAVIAGTAFHADPDTAAHAGALAGITRHAAGQDDPLAVQFAGQMKDPAWSWTAGPIFVGPAGVLTQSRPATGWISRIATAINATTLIVHRQISIGR